MGEDLSDEKLQKIYSIREGESEKQCFTSYEVDQTTEATSAFRF